MRPWILIILFNVIRLFLFIINHLNSLNYRWDITTLPCNLWKIFCVFLIKTLLWKSNWDAPGACFVSLAGYLHNIVTLVGRWVEGIQGLYTILCFIGVTNHLHGMVSDCEPVVGIYNTPNDTNQNEAYDRVSKSLSVLANLWICLVHLPDRGVGRYGLKFRDPFHFFDHFFDQECVLLKIFDNGVDMLRLEGCRLLHRHVNGVLFLHILL